MPVMILLNTVVRLIALGVAAVVGTIYVLALTSAAIGRATSPRLPG